MISAISWIPKGASKAEPVRAQPPPKDEIEDEIEDEDEDMDANAIRNKHTDQVSQALALALKALDMEHYDDEDEGVDLLGSGIDDRYYSSNKLDPYIKHKEEEEEEDDSEELEDVTIIPTDSVIVCARNKNNVGHIEFCILEDDNLNIYNRNHINIPAFPLCTAWLDCPLKGGERGNFIAVGSMEPSIEIWDLDVIDVVEPCVILGGISDKMEKEKKKSIKYKDDSHTDSVLGLAWNKEYRNILASASADKRVKIWDVVAGKCDITMEHHSDKVQAVAWNHHAPQVLLSGSFDRTVVLKDGRMPSHSGYKWSVTADVEHLAWDPHNEHSFVVSLEDGIVKCFDVRTAKADSASELSSTFTLHAHVKAVTSVSYNLSAPNLLATGSKDETVKLWDLSNNQPSCIASKTPKAGAVFSISFSEDNPFLLAIGGSRGKLKVWDTLSESSISQRYENYNKKKPQSRS